MMRRTLWTAISFMGGAVGVLIVEEGFESGALLDISNPSGSTPEVIQTTTLVPANT
jgi:hypothetical protein